MNTKLETICKSLEDLSDSILAATTEERTMTEAWGWNQPAVTRHDLANIPKSLSIKIRELNSVKLSQAEIDDLDEIPERIKIFKKHTLIYLFNGNGSVAVPMLMSLMDLITSKIDPLFNWEVLLDNKALPAQLSRKLRGIQSDLDEIVPDKERLKEQIKLIQDATEAAESLPTDLQSLKEARKKVDLYSTDSATLFSKIDTNHQEADKRIKALKEKEAEAEGIVQQCHEAYRVATSKGLAGAFDLRARKLQMSTWVWVGGLLIALGIGATIGSHRVTLLSTALTQSNPQWGAIWMHLILSILSIGAPIWFAWLATKQINQRFRLSEDYAFKASVAKAYEGFRREAARIDPAFEARLFSSALTRLEEAPLRLVETEHHGSPWHELISSPAFEKALNTVPELKEHFIEVAKNGISKFKSKPEITQTTTSSASE